MERKNKKNGLIVIAAFICAALAIPLQVWGTTSGTFETRVIQLSDDAEETTGVSTNIYDLELGDKLCGIRFQNVSIPRYSTITNAYIQFTVDEVRTDPTNLTIYGHNTFLIFDSPDFDTLSISVRNKTLASVAWSNVPQWGTIGEIGVSQQTPDLKAIVQEIVNDFSWNDGDAMTFIIEGSGERVARAFRYASEYGEDVAPLLHIEYVADALTVQVSDTNDDVEEKADGNMFITSPDLDFFNSTDRGTGIRFQNLTIPQGVQITKAFIEFVAHNEGADTTTGASSFVIKTEAADNSAAFSYTLNDLSSRSLSGQTITWDPVPDWDKEHTYRTPDLSAIVQEVIGRSGWISGNAMTFIFNQGTGWRCAYSFDTDPTKAATLHVEWDTVLSPFITTDTNTIGASCFETENAPADSLLITNSGSGTMDYTLSENSTWFSLSSTSGTILAGDDEAITVNYNTTGLAIGTYTDKIIITAPGAPNSPMEITVSITVLEQDETYSCGHVPVYAENIISPALLILLDVSGSMNNKINVSPNTEKPTTPDLSTIVQEIVDRPGWASGNAMAFIIESNGVLGRRTAVSYDQNSGFAPLLHVAYTDGTDHEIDVRVSQSSDDGEEKIGQTSVLLTSADLEMVDDQGNGEQVIGIRFQNLAIPQGATISEAYIEFVIDENDSVTTHLKIAGQDMDNPPTFADLDDNISSRTKTSAVVEWNNIPEWGAGTMEPKIDIAKSTIIDLIKDRSISWGFGSWVGDREPYDSVPDYTIVHEGCKPHTADHEVAIRDAVNALTATGNTPFAPSIEAARKYFTSAKPEDEDQATTGDTYVSAECQPKFLINITDGIGNKESTTAGVNTNTAALADEEVSSIAVGFGLPLDQAEQIYEMAKVANEKGNISETDDIFALHEELAGVGQPFFAYSKQELIDAMTTITENIKAVVFHGSAPAPTTSVDLGDTVILAKFDAANWVGDVEAIRQDSNGLWVNTVWSASEELPTTRSVWTIDPNDANAKNVVAYTDSILATDNFGCNATKPIGDIVNSTPVVVGPPPFWYPFDNYTTFRNTTTRDTMVYIGANDGSLHAIRLVDGVEQWAFVPKSMHDKLNLAQSDPLYDRCAQQYCHQYYVDGSPIVGDVYADFDGNSTKEWRTMLVIGEREGGEAYFALDVTSGENLDDPSDPTKYLWEFTDSELGQTWADPSISRTGIKDSSEAAWGTFFGSGYLPDPAQQANKEAYIFGIVAHDAADYWKDAGGNTTNRIKVVQGGDPKADIKNYDHVNKPFSVGEIVTGKNSGATAEVVAVTNISGDDATLTLTNVIGTFQANERLDGDPAANKADLDGALIGGSGSSFPNNAMASPRLVDLEGDYTTDRIYAGDLYGNMYRLDNIGKHMTPVVTTLFTYDNASPNVNPIRAKADYAYTDTPGEIWVYFGSGMFETQTDKTDYNQQYFFGLKDGNTPAATYHLNDPVLLQAKFDTETIDGVEQTFRYVDGSNPYNESWKMQLFAGQTGWGWNEAAPSGSERVITQPLAVAGIVLFTTFIPDEDVCAGSGDTWVFAVDYRSGLNDVEPIFDINGDEKFDDNDKVSVNGNLVIPIGIKVGRGKGSHPVLHKDVLFVTVTGDGNDGGGSGSDDEDFFAKKINLPNKKVRVRSWMQR